MEILAVLTRKNSRIACSKFHIPGILIAMLTFGCLFPHQPIQTFQRFEVYGEFGSGNAQFNFPMGIALRKISDSIGIRTYIADYANNRISVWGWENGRKFIESIGDSGNGLGQFNRPKDLTLTQTVLGITPFVPRDNMYIYVTDSKNHRIQKLDLMGVPVLAWGSFGNGPGQFDTPSGIDIDFEGNIYVVDSGNHRIQVFDSLGNFLRTWGKFGNSDGEFQNPIDVAVGFKLREPTSFDFVAVSDNGNNRVQVFDRFGQLKRIYNNIPAVLGIDVVYITTTSTRQILAISGSSKLLYLLSDDVSRVSTEHISETMNPYDVAGYKITDVGSHKVFVYGWSPED